MVDNSPILVTSARCPWCKKAIADATRLGFLAERHVRIVSVDGPAQRAWFQDQIGGKEVPTLVVWTPGGVTRVEGYPNVSTQLHAWAAPPKPAGQVAAGPNKALPAAKYAIYVSSTCGACAKALQMIGSSPTLLQKIEVRKLDGNPRAILEMHDLGAVRTPALVALDAAGKPTGNAFEGPGAWSKIISIA